jgi:hypothetical protein
MKALAPLGLFGGGSLMRRPHSHYPLATTSSRITLVRAAKTFSAPFSETDDYPYPVSHLRGPP